jgi:hypothetical protein
MNWKAIFASQRRFTPLERILLDAVSRRLDGRARELLGQQVGAINHIQRLPGWDEIDFYALRFPRRVSWTPDSAFPNKAEFQLASCKIKTRGRSIPVTLSAVGGHVFSIEAEEPLKSVAFATDLTVEDVVVSDVIMKEQAASQMPELKVMETHPEE